MHTAHCRSADAADSAPFSARLDALVASAGFRDLRAETWDQARELDEWLAIVNDPVRTGPLGIVIRALAASGNGAGIELHEEDGRIHFRHRWRLVVATRV